MKVRPRELNIAQSRNLESSRDSKCGAVRGHTRERHAEVVRVQQPGVVVHRAYARMHEPGISQQSRAQALRCPPTGDAHVARHGEFRAEMAIRALSAALEDAHSGLLLRAQGIVVALGEPLKAEW